jgi:hypothetical protein
MFQTVKHLLFQPHEKDHLLSFNQMDRVRRNAVVFWSIVMIIGFALATGGAAAVTKCLARAPGGAGERLQ